MIPEAAPHFLGEVVALLVAGAAIAYVGYRLGLVPIVGFLIAGVIIGPSALGLVRQPEVVNAAAEAGVVLLLFTIGIEFNLEKLGRMRRLIFVGGGLQVLLATVATLLILTALGVAWRAALFTGFLVALSSTAIVLKLLADRGETNAEHGRIALGILIFQDLIIIPMVLLLPLLSGAGRPTTELLWALLKAVVIIAVVLLFARRFMPALLEAVARTCSPEIFLLTVVAICFGTAFVTSLAGVSISLGAFLAGLLVSESRFSEHALGEILPLQILFSATFFVSIGMLLDIDFLFRHLPMVLALSAALLAVKVLTTALSLRSCGHPLPVALGAGLMLAQVGEFSFVLERSGRELGLYPAGMANNGAQTFIAATVLLMIITPQLAQLGARLSGFRPVLRHTPRHVIEPEPVTGTPVELRDHIIVAGYGQGARVLVRGLDRAGVPYAITTLNPEGASEAEAEARIVRRGDATRRNLLELVGIEQARAIVIADDDAATARRIVSVARVANPELRIIVRTRFAADIAPLRQAGANDVIAEERTSAHALLRDALAVYELLPIEGADSAQELAPPLMVTSACAHTREIRDVAPRTPNGCEECLQSGDRWVHLRLCRTCGHVGCCDTSPNRHATQHFHATSHPIARSYEPGERWSWCYVDHVRLEDV